MNCCFSLSPALHFVANGRPMGRQERLGALGAARDVGAGLLALATVVAAILVPGLSAETLVFLLAIGPEDRQGIPQMAGGLGSGHRPRNNRTGRHSGARARNRASDLLATCFGKTVALAPWVAGQLGFEGGRSSFSGRTPRVPCRVCIDGGVSFFPSRCRDHDSLSLVEVPSGIFDGLNQTPGQSALWRARHRWQVWNLAQVFMSYPPTSG